MNNRDENLSVVILRCVNEIRQALCISGEATGRWSLVVEVDRHREPFRGDVPIRVEVSGIDLRDPAPDEITLFRITSEPKV